MTGTPLAVVDTNVLLIANLQHPGVSPEGVIACIEWLERLQSGGCVVLDDLYEIVTEYGRKTDAYTGNRPGDAFLKWVLNNVANPQCICQVSIQKHHERGYLEFPDDVELRGFDRADRKFVAVARVHPKRPQILQGSDAKWLAWSDCLAAHGVVVNFICRADVERFSKRKRKRNA